MSVSDFPDFLSGFLSSGRSRGFCGSFFIGCLNLVFEDLGNCLWGLKPPHPLCSRASPLHAPHHFPVSCSASRPAALSILSLVRLIKSVRGRSKQGRHCKKTDWLDHLPLWGGQGIKSGQTCSLMVWDSQTSSTSLPDNPTH